MTNTAKSRLISRVSFKGDLQHLLLQAEGYGSESYKCSRSYGLWRCVKVSHGHIAALPMTFTSPCEQGICDWVHSSGSLTVCVQADTWMCAGIYMAFFCAMLFIPKSANVSHMHLCPFQISCPLPFQECQGKPAPTQKWLISSWPGSWTCRISLGYSAVRGGWWHWTASMTWYHSMSHRESGGCHSAKLQLPHPLHHQQLGESRNQ